MTNDNTTAWVYYDKAGNRTSRPQSMDNHGPSNEPGLTTKEYYEMMDLEAREREDRLDWR